MKLHEIADTKVQYKILRQSESAFGLEATIGNRIIRFVAKKDMSDGDDSEDAWIVDFTEVTYGEQGKVDRTHAKTGHGKEFEVTAFVTKALKEFVSIYNPEQIYFSSDKAEGENRSRVYLKLADRLLKGYKRDEPHPIDAISDLDLFVYRKT